MKTVAQIWKEFDAASAQELKLFRSREVQLTIARALAASYLRANGWKLAAIASALECSCERARQLAAKVVYHEGV